MPEHDGELDLALWASCGAMELTGSASGPPAVPRGRPAGAAADLIARLHDALRRLTGRTAGTVSPQLLGERAAIAGLSRAAPWSCGGAFTVFPTADGWAGLSLARSTDRAAVGALVESGDVVDPWQAVLEWARARDSAVVEERLRLLGMPGGSVVPAGSRTRPGVVRRDGGVRRRALGPLVRVVDMSGLWAGPLSTSLLVRNGVEVIKVESVTRPDGARRGPRPFFDLLNAGKRMVAVDLGDGAGRDALRRLIASADLVVESSRPRAMRAIGIDAEEVVASGVSWLSLTARGRESQAVGFGDDIAAGAGLVAMHAGAPVPAGDAIADPLAGLTAAVEAADVLAGDQAVLIDVSMHDVVAEIADAPVPEHAVRLREGRWWLETEHGRTRVRPPLARAPDGRAAPLGAHNAGLLT